MVFPADYMERSNTLHNFNFPNLRWGSQRHLRCMKVHSARLGGGSGTADHRYRRRSSPLKFESSSESTPVRFGDVGQRSNNLHRRLRTVPSRSAEEGIEEFREKIMSDLRMVADKMTESIFRKQALRGEDEEEQNDGGGEEKEKERQISPAITAEAKPWNLRTRRAACKAPISGTGNFNDNQYNGLNHNNKGLKNEERRMNSSSLMNESVKFSLPLTRKEIEEDFMEVLGRRPPRRPKKRPKTVQKQLDFLFPGLYLAEIRVNTYKVPEAVENGKR